MYYLNLTLENATLDNEGAVLFSSFYTYYTLSQVLIFL